MKKVTVKEIDREADIRKCSQPDRYTHTDPIQPPTEKRTVPSHKQAQQSENLRDRSEQELRLVTSRPIPDVYNCIAH